MFGRKLECFSCAANGTQKQKRQKLHPRIFRSLLLSVYPSRPFIIRSLSLSFCTHRPIFCVFYFSFVHSSDISLTTTHKKLKKETFYLFAACEHPIIYLNFSTFQKSREKRKKNENDYFSVGRWDSNAFRHFLYVSFAQFSGPSFGINDFRMHSNREIKFMKKIGGGNQQFCVTVE